MLTFYARGKELPDERKLYKYRLIRIEPSKIIFWKGYNFGRFISKKRDEPTEDSLNLTPDEAGVELAAKLLQPSENEIPGPRGFSRFDRDRSHQPLLQSKLSPRKLLSRREIR